LFSITLQKFGAAIPSGSTLLQAFFPVVALRLPPAIGLDSFGMTATLIVNWNKALKAETLGTTGSKLLDFCKSELTSTGGIVKVGSSETF
jgi:hypothetical protein